MHLQFLVEDTSGGDFIQTIMGTLLSDKPHITYDCKSFRGIGGFSKKININRAKTQKLLNDLPQYLKGFDKRLSNSEAAIFIVLDNDRRDVISFSNELKEVAKSTGITVDHVFCVAVEEMEAWLLGDVDAVLAAYPDARLSTIQSYVQDSICGTWEILAHAVYPGGKKKFLKDCPTYREVGLYKSIWAKCIGQHMCFEKNQSPSFRFFYAELMKRIA